jgi:hypothetical protein
LLRYVHCLYIAVYRPCTVVCGIPPTIEKLPACGQLFQSPRNGA